MPTETEIEHARELCRERRMTDIAETRVHLLEVEAAKTLADLAEARATIRVLEASTPQLRQQHRADLRERLLVALLRHHAGQSVGWLVDKADCLAAALANSTDSTEVPR
jgi:hypothetical protein